MGKCMAMGEIEDTLLKHKSSFYSGEDKNE